MIKQILLLALCLGGIASFGTTRNVECTAHVTNRVFQVSLDAGSRNLKIVSDTGYIREGNANYYFSPLYGSDFYFLATGFDSAIEIELERGGQQRIALCLKATECYLCRK